MRTLIALWFLGAILGAGVPEAEGCSCLRQGPPCEDYWTAAAIFRGRVDSIASEASPPEAPVRFRTVRFTVLESFKGTSGTAVAVTTAVGGATCGYRFMKGREYLVYASVEPGGALTTSVCTRTRPVERAQADLEYARSIAGGGMPLGGISGRVLMVTRDLSTGRHRTRPMRSALVTVRLGDVSATTQSNRAGEFAVVGLEPGAYTIGVDLAGSFRVDVSPEPVVIRDARGCAEAQANVYPDGRVSGRVLDASGKPVRGLTVDLTIPRPSDRGPTGPDADRLRAVTGTDGRYEVAGVPPGRFVVGISAGREPAHTLRAYHPGVTQESDAARFTVPEGGRVALGDFVIPASIRLLEISGVVLDSELTPVDAARVYLRGPAERDFILTEAVVTDVSGRFTIAAIEQEYLLFAERARPGIGHRRMDSTDLLRIVPPSGRASVRLTLRPRY